MEQDNTTTLDGEAGSCVAGSLTGSLGLFVQALLAFIAFSALIVKRFCEPYNERRSWLIWFFDTSKQAIGANVIHFSNIFLSTAIFHGDPCTWYVVSFLLDSTLGLLIICVGLKLCQFVIRLKRYHHLSFGHYGSPARCSAWLGQCALYIGVMLVEKLLMTLLIMFDFWKYVRQFILYPVKDPQLRLIIVMFVVPLVVNALVFWVVDNYLKERRSWREDKEAPPRGGMSIVDGCLPPGSNRRSPDGGRYTKIRRTDSGSDMDELLSMEEDCGIHIHPIPSRVGIRPHPSRVGVRSDRTLCPPERDVV